jgi:hypothetical protein
MKDTAFAELVSSNKRRPESPPSDSPWRLGLRWRAGWLRRFLRRGSHAKGQRHKWLQPTARREGSVIVGPGPDLMAELP